VPKSHFGGEKIFLNPPAPPENAQVQRGASQQAVLQK
jgi:hypothetical protein